MNCFQLVKSVLDELYGRVPGATEDEKDGLIRANLTSLSRSYALLSKTNTVDHSNLASRFAYIYRYVTSHANFVYQVIRKSAELRDLFNCERVNITCIGGGPGSDFLGVIKFLEGTDKKPTLKCILYDKENAWGECWNDVDEKLSTELQIRTFCQTFDVTLASSWENNSKYLSSDLFTMIYFLSEVYSLRTDAEPFFMNMFENAKSGALFLFLDNNSSVFYDWFDDMVDHSPIEVLAKYEGNIVISDYSEEKTDLGEYWTKFGHPKLGADAAYRICRRR
jgi:hypothetical protein